ncbi:flagellar basal body rod protein FlgB [Syntrophomonas palmitatica]|uniref:flagellar basal body rod protein FlgB n=1 Tax=Syntrophomonas palmitatica TaxID=402877 RepID=UPI0006CF416A|nr:flagellar basal body rod protein FlgB [Syntrophomonas palmitatica]
MFDRIFNSPSQYLIKQAMDVAALRNEVIADNIANVDTPKFKRREVIFEENIKKVLQNTTKNGILKTNDPRHLQMKEDNPVMVPEIRTMEDLSYRNDENNVDIDVETAKMAKNKIIYDSNTQSLNSELKLLRMAITGRG